MHASTIVSSIALAMGLMAQGGLATVAYGKSSANEPSKSPLPALPLDAKISCQVAESSSTDISGSSCLDLWRIRM